MPKFLTRFTIAEMRKKRGGGGAGWTSEWWGLWWVGELVNNVGVLSICTHFSSVCQIIIYQLNCLHTAPTPSIYGGNRSQIALVSANIGVVLEVVLGVVWIYREGGMCVCNRRMELIQSVRLLCENVKRSLPKKILETPVAKWYHEILQSVEENSLKYQ